MANNTLKYRRIDPELREKIAHDWNPADPLAAVG
jgi:oligopeptide transport system substrate-binding protein